MAISESYKKKISELAPSEFENLVYDLLMLSGMRNLVWRTPGSDGGRDIEGYVLSSDISGHTAEQKWYVECKLYSSSVDWPTVFKKISYAVSNDADYLLLATNQNPSPACETEISKWNVARKNPKLRVWRGYELLRLVEYYPAVLVKYGLNTSAGDIEVAFLPLLRELMKLSQSSYAAMEFKSAIESFLETSAALSELISVRVDQLKSDGRFTAVDFASEPPGYGWLSWNGSFQQWDDVSVRALLTFVRYLFGAKQIEVHEVDSVITLTVVNAKCEITPATEKAFKEVLVWTNFEITSTAGSVLTIQNRVDKGRSS